MARLNTERQNKLEPIRMRTAINEIQRLGLTTLNCTDKMIEFEYKGHSIKYFPYSGWATGKTIKDGRGANLRGADYSEHTSFLSYQCPTEGSFIGWKKCGRYIVKLKICEDAERSSSTSLKCRCSKAEVLEIQNMDGSTADITEICSNYNKDFIYKVGETVEVKDFDKCRWNECSNGIHFFIDRNVAVAYRK